MEVAFLLLSHVCCQRKSTAKYSTTYRF